MEKIILLLVIIALLSVVIYLNIKKMREIKTIITLGIKIDEDNLYFTKKFYMFVPKTDRIDIFKERFVVHDYNFEPLEKTLKIFAHSENLKIDNPDLLLEKFHLDGWVTENLTFIPE